MNLARRHFLRASAVATCGLPALPILAAGAAASGSAPLRHDFSWNRREHLRRTGRWLPRSQSLYFEKEPHCPVPGNMEGQTSYYPQTRIRDVRQRLQGVDRKAYLQGILDHVLVGVGSDRDRIAVICRFVGDALCYNAVQCPFETKDGGKTWIGILDPLELLELHDGRCGQGVRVTRALLDLMGIESRFVTCVHHTSCEARYDGGWHLADALMFGAGQPQREGVVLSADELKREPYLADAVPMPYLYGQLEEYFSEDGFRALGYVFGEWGAGMPYQSYYWGAPMATPPTLPYPLVTQRLGGRRVRLNWAPSIKAGGGAIEYRVVIFADRDCREPVHTATTAVASLEWEVPAMNTIYYFETTAMDDHRRHNPATWYLAVRNNFMLVPEGQYGWYGVI